MLDWLEKDQVAFWKAEIRRREEKVNEAQTALHRKRITAAFGNIAADSEEILMLRRAQAKLAQAEDKLSSSSSGTSPSNKKCREYRGPVQQLSNLLDSSVPLALTSLDRMTDVIESYLAIATPGSAPGGLNLGADIPLAGSEANAATQSAGAAATGEGRVDRLLRRAQLGSTIVVKQGDLTPVVGSLRFAIKDLRAKWDDTKEVWRDDVARRFERSRAPAR